MKKTVSLFLVIGAVLCLAGCGNKPSTLKCTQKINNVNVELTSNFIGKKVNSMTLKYEMDFSGYSDSAINTLSSNDFCDKVKTSMGSQFTLVGCTQKLEGKNMIVTSGIDITKFNKSELVGSPEETKKELEKSGYTCTLK